MTMEDKKTSKTKWTNKKTKKVAVKIPETKLKNNEDELLFEIIRWSKDKKKAEKAMADTKKDLQTALEEIKNIQESIGKVQHKVAKLSRFSTWSWIKSLFYNK